MNESLKMNMLSDVMPREQDPAFPISLQPKRGNKKHIEFINQYETSGNIG